MNDEPTIRELIEARNSADSAVEYKVSKFLAKLHTAGEHAPTVSKPFGGGLDTIEEITFQYDPDRVRLVGTNWFKGNEETWVLEYPAELIDNPNEEAIKTFAASEKKAREDAEATRKQAVAEDTRRQELQALARLKSKYEGKSLRDCLEQP